MRARAVKDAWSDAATEREKAGENNIFLAQNLGSPMRLRAALVVPVVLACLLHATGVHGREVPSSLQLPLREVRRARANSATRAPAPAAAPEAVAVPP